jgi:hypothetical protein
MKSKKESIKKIYPPYELRQYMWLYCPHDNKFVLCRFDGIQRGLKRGYDLALYTSVGNNNHHSTATLRMERTSMYRRCLEEVVESEKIPKLQKR